MKVLGNSYQQLEQLGDRELVRTFQSVDDNFEQMNTLIPANNNAVNTVGNVITDVAKVVETIKRIDADIKVMDMQLQYHLKQADVNLEKFNTAAVIIGKQLDDCSIRVDKTLEKALAIDTKTANEEELKVRNQLLSMVNDWSSIISNLMMKLMSY